MTELDAFKVKIDWAQKQPAKARKLQTRTRIAIFLMGLIFGVAYMLMWTIFHLDLPFWWFLVIGIIGIGGVAYLIVDCEDYAVKLRFPVTKYDAALEKEER